MNKILRPMANVAKITALQAVQRQNMVFNQTRMLHMLTNRATVTPVNMFQSQARFAFSSTEGKLNDNEIIELVEGKVFEVLKSAAKCDHSKLSRTATFEQLGFDSLDGVELVLAMEEHFGFDLTNEDAEKITTVMDAI